MNSATMKKSYSLVMFAFLFFLTCTDAVSSEKGRKILLIVSDSAIEKYRIAHAEFEKSVHYPIRVVNLGETGKERINTKSLVSYDPDLVYCIGSKAYTFAKEIFGRKDILISSSVNLLRLSLTSGTYAISNEPHARTPLLIFRSVFPGMKKIGILYSRKYSSEWLGNTKEMAKELGFEIIEKSISDNTDTESVLKQLLPNIHALWVISDPLVIPNVEAVKKIFLICDQHRKPIFTFSDAFVEIGATLIVAADDATIGRQAADMAAELLFLGKPDEKIRYPAGSQVIVNLKKTNEYGIEYDRMGLSEVNKVIR